MLGCPKCASCAHINNWNIEEHDQDISKIRECPKISKIKSGNITKNTKSRNKKTDTSHETTEDIELEVEIEEPIETTETAATTEAATETTESQEKES